MPTTWSDIDKEWSNPLLLPFLGPPEKHRRVLPERPGKSFALDFPARSVQRRLGVRRITSAGSKLKSTGFTSQKPSVRNRFNPATYRWLTWRMPAACPALEVAAECSRAEKSASSSRRASSNPSLPKPVLSRSG